MDILQEGQAETRNLSSEYTCFIFNFYQPQFLCQHFLELSWGSADGWEGFLTHSPATGARLANTVRLAIALVLKMPVCSNATEL